MNLYHLAFIHFQNLWIFHTYKINFPIFTSNTFLRTLLSPNLLRNYNQKDIWLLPNLIYNTMTGKREALKLLLCGSIQSCTTHLQALNNKHYQALWKTYIGSYNAHRWTFLLIHFHKYYLQCICILHSDFHWCWWWSVAFLQWLDKF